MITTKYLVAVILVFAWTGIGHTAEECRGGPDPSKFKAGLIYAKVSRGGSKRFLESDSKFALDEQGVLRTVYNEGHEGANAPFYNPVFIGGYVNALYQDYRYSSGAEEFRKSIRNQADRLWQEAKPRQVGARQFWVWEYPFPSAKFSAPRGWISGLAQGRVVATMVMAYEVSRDIKYLCAAEKAFGAFLVPMKDGGVSTFDNKSIWFEEVAHPSIPSSRILNGHISALQGVWLYWQWTSSAEAEAMVRGGIEAVRQEISLYDAGIVSYYSQVPDNPRILAPLNGYHQLHIKQLLWLAEVGNDAVFLDYALRFARHADPAWTVTTGCSAMWDTRPGRWLWVMWSKYIGGGESPCWTQIDLNEVEDVSGVTMAGYRSLTGVKNGRLDIYTSLDRKKWDFAVTAKSSPQGFTRIVFPARRAISVRVYTDLVPTQNSSAGLLGVGINPTAIADADSYSATIHPALIFSATGLKSSPRKGWLLTDLVQARNFTLHVAEPAKVQLAIYGSPDLHRFEPLNVRDETHNGHRTLKVINPSSRYVRIDMDKGDLSGLRLQFDP